MESYVITPLNTLIRLYLSPSNLIAKRHNKLLDYDSACSTYEKIKDQQLKQVSCSLSVFGEHSLDHIDETFTGSIETNVWPIEQSIAGRAASPLPIQLSNINTLFALLHRWLWTPDAKDAHGSSLDDWSGAQIDSCCDSIPCRRSCLERCRTIELARYHPTLLGEEWTCLGTSLPIDHRYEELLQ